MHTIIPRSVKDQDTYSLLLEKERLESRMIQGTATSAMIDRYAAAQLELAERPELDFLLDPRD